ncbi:MAG TPA: pectate lyase [Candidatus Synoicihabitans sp.]|nr:pectate lyase [Candidatus Synoicihabitans sp.]
MVGSILSPKRSRALLCGWMLMALVGRAAAQAAPAWNAILRQPKAWYGSEEARQVAASVVSYQAPIGGWPKNIDMTRPASAPTPDRECTIDNGGTTTQLQFLARVVEADPARSPTVRQAVERGLDYLLQAQYENGGWPQFFPLRRGYYTHITYNDNAMARVLNVLQAVAQGTKPFAWVDEVRRSAAAKAVVRGIDCILRTQVRVNGELTAWCAQHDAVTLAPARARAFEPVSLSGAESVGLIEFLIEAAPPSAEVIAAVESGVRWLNDVKLVGWRVERPTLGDDTGRRDQVLVPHEGAVAWARFYEIGTNRPIFAGRDTVIHDHLAAIEVERRVGYTYYGTWAEDLLAKSYPAWRAKLAARSTSK